MQNQALLEGLQDILNLDGDDASGDGVGNHHHVTDKADLRLTSGGDVLADHLVRVDAAAVSKRGLGGHGTHAHLENLVLPQERVVLRGLGLGALALLLLAQVGDLAYAVAIRLIPVKQFAGVDVVLVHFIECWKFHEKFQSFTILSLSARISATCLRQASSGRTDGAAPGRDTPASSTSRLVTDVSV